MPSLLPGVLINPPPAGVFRRVSCGQCNAYRVDLDGGWAMGKMLYSATMSLDGFIAGPADGGDAR